MVLAHKGADCQALSRGMFSYICTSFRQVLLLGLRRFYAKLSQIMRKPADDWTHAIVNNESIKDTGKTEASL